MKNDHTPKTEEQEFNEGTPEHRHVVAIRLGREASDGLVHHILEENPNISYEELKSELEYDEFVKPDKPLTELKDGSTNQDVFGAKKTGE